MNPDKEALSGDAAFHFIKSNLEPVTTDTITTLLAEGLGTSFERAIKHLEGGHVGIDDLKVLFAIDVATEEKRTLLQITVLASYKAKLEYLVTLAFNHNGQLIGAPITTCDEACPLAKAHCSHVITTMCVTCVLFTCSTLDEVKSRMPNGSGRLISEAAVTAHGLSRAYKARGRAKGPEGMSAAGSAILKKEERKNKRTVVGAVKKVESIVANGSDVKGTEGAKTMLEAAVMYDRERMLPRDRSDHQLSWRFVEDLACNWHEATLLSYLVKTENDIARDLGRSVPAMEAEVVGGSNGAGAVGVGAMGGPTEGGGGGIGWAKAKAKGGCRVGTSRVVEGSVGGSFVGMDTEDLLEHVRQVGLSWGGRQGAVGWAGSNAPPQFNEEFTYQNPPTPNNKIRASELLLVSECHSPLIASPVAAEPESVPSTPTDPHAAVNIAELITPGPGDGHGLSTTGLCLSDGDGEMDEDSSGEESQVSLDSFPSLDGAADTPPSGLGANLRAGAAAIATHMSRARWPSMQAARGNTKAGKESPLKRAAAALRARLRKPY